MVTFKVSSKAQSETEDNNFYQRGPCTTKVPNEDDRATDPKGRKDS